MEEAVPNLKRYANRIIKEKLTGKKLSGLVRTVSNHHEHQVIFDWLTKHDFFKDITSVIEGLANSKLRGTLTNEFQIFLGKNGRIIEAALCYRILELSIPKDFLSKFDLRVYDCCVLICLHLYLNTSGGMLLPGFLLKFSRMEREFGLPNRSIFVNNRFSKIDERESLLLQIRYNREVKTSDQKLIEELGKQALSLIDNQLEDISHIERLFLATSFLMFRINKFSALDLRIYNEWSSYYIELTDGIVRAYKGRKKRISRTFVRNKLNNSDRHLIRYLSNGEIGKGQALTVVNILLLRLFTNYELNISIEELNLVPIFKKHIEDLCRLDVLDKEHISRSFNWPELRNVSLINFHLSDHYSLFQGITPLKFIGYTVGKLGLDQLEREEILDSFYLGQNKLAERFISKYDDSWGNPKSAKRLKKMAEHLVIQIANKEKLGFMEAVEDWTEDYYYLKEKYYSPISKAVIEFSFPRLK